MILASTSHSAFQSPLAFCLDHCFQLGVLFHLKFPLEKHLNFWIEISHTGDCQFYLKIFRSTHGLWYQLALDTEWLFTYVSSDLPSKVRTAMISSFLSCWCSKSPSLSGKLVWMFGARDCKLAISFGDNFRLRTLYVECLCPRVETQWDSIGFHGVKAAIVICEAPRSWNF